MSEATVLTAILGLIGVVAAAAMGLRGSWVSSAAQAIDSVIRAKDAEIERLTERLSKARRIIRQQKATIRNLQQS